MVSKLMMCPPMPYQAHSYVMSVLEPRLLFLHALETHLLPALALAAIYFSLAITMTVSVHLSSFGILIISLWMLASRMTKRLQVFSEKYPSCKSHPVHPLVPRSFLAVPVLKLYPIVDFFTCIYNGLREKTDLAEVFYFR